MAQDGATFMNIKRAAAALGMAVMLSTSAGAATIEQIQYIDFPTTPIIDLTLDGVFNQYNGPGTLTAVQLSWNINSGGLVTATGCNSSQLCEPGTYSLRISGSGAFTGVSQIDVDGPLEQVITNDTNELQTGIFTRLISNTFNFSNLAPFVGNGALALPDTIDVVTAYNGVFDSLSGGLLGQVALVYTVCDQPVCDQQIPEPAGLAVLGLGLTALGLVRRRRAA